MRLGLILIVLLGYVHQMHASQHRIALLRAVAASDVELVYYELKTRNVTKVDLSICIEAADHIIAQKTSLKRSKLNILGLGLLAPLGIAAASLCVLGVPWSSYAVLMKRGLVAQKNVLLKEKKALKKSKEVCEEWDKHNKGVRQRRLEKILKRELQSDKALKQADAGLLELEGALRDHGHDIQAAENSHVIASEPVQTNTAINALREKHAALKEARDKLYVSNQRMVESIKGRAEYLDHESYELTRAKGNLKEVEKKICEVNKRLQPQNFEEYAKEERPLFLGLALVAGFASIFCIKKAFDFWREPYRQLSAARAIALMLRRAIKGLGSVSAQSIGDEHKPVEVGETS